MENFNALSEQLATRNKEVERLDGEIKEVTAQIEQMKVQYPKLLTPPSVEAKRLLEDGERSDWREDDVEITGDEKDLKMKNVSKLERLQQKIEEEKIKAGELAFKMVSMTETNSTEYERGNIRQDILDIKEKVNATSTEMKEFESTEVYFSPGAYRTDPNANKNSALLHAVGLLKPTELYGKRISYKDLVETLKQEFKIDMDEQSQEMVRAAYKDLLKKQDELYRQKHGD